MKTLRTSFSGVATFALILSACCYSQAAFVYFDGSESEDFSVAANWTPESAPGSNLDDIYGIDDGLSSVYNGGTTQIFGLRVGSAAKEHQIGDTHFGRLTMNGGTLEVIGSGGMGFFGIGREREPIITDPTKKGGELIMTGTSSITANGLIVGERTLGLMTIGPQASVELRAWVTTQEPAQFGGTEDLRIGNYGPAYDDFGAEPNLDGRGVMEVAGSLLANNLYFSEHGAKGELRLLGGSVTLNGSLIMDLCDNCQSDPDLLAMRLAKVSIVGSTGQFTVGMDPDPNVIDPEPPDRDILAASPTAVFSFTADAGGVSPLVVAQNPDEASGGAEIEGAQLELDLDAFAFTSSSRLTLIDATPTRLLGEFGSVTFLGDTTADVNYDLVNGDVYLDNFHSSAPNGDFDGDGDVDGVDFLVWQRGESPTPLSATDLSAWQSGFGGGTLAAARAVPEPAATMLALLACGVLLFTIRRRSAGNAQE